MFCKHVHMHLKKSVARQTRQTKTCQTRRYLRQKDNACCTPAGFVDSVDSTGELVEEN